VTDKPTVVERDTWLAARRSLLAEEKNLTRQLDKVAEQRRAMPWVRIDKTYVFDTPDGEQSLGDLFADRSQLIVYHFMLGPDWDEGCPSCSFWADNFNGIDVHLADRDTTLLAVSRSPVDVINAYKARMGWDFRWVSSARTDFNIDFGGSVPEGRYSDANFAYDATGEPADEAHGVSVFTRDTFGDVFHTYSAYARGVEIFNGAYQLLDLTPKGRDEDDLPWTMAWLRRHDSYDPR
jgi:predicted dithiol-disulfide oxidoreductase (DUF899 family)